MFRLLIDTCVWLDLAKDNTQQPLLRVLEELIQQRRAVLILPQIVLDEFARNRDRILKEGTQSISSAIKRTKDMVARFGSPQRKQAVLDALGDVDHKLPTMSESALEAIGRIEKLFRAAPRIATSDAVKLRAAGRAIDQKAPFHQKKNSINDAMLIEIYAHQIAMGTGDRFAFVTHNKRDFSDTNEKQPHPDIAHLFSRIKSLYFIRLADALRRVAPELVTDVMIEEEWSEQPRALSEILGAIDLLFHQVWYNRHHNTRYAIETGKTKIVEKETFPVKDHARRPIQRDVWERALKAAARVEREYGLENLGPWSDFEWGIINGKLSALRWVLGVEWDMLDT